MRGTLVWSMKVPAHINGSLLSWVYVTAIIVVTGIVMALATPMPQDDHFYYQQFIETLAAGKLDLSIPGFHGMNILSVPWYWVTHSPLTQIHVQMVAGVLLPMLAFLVARGIFRSNMEGILFASIIALMPFLFFSALRGWMVAFYNFLFFLTIIGALRGVWWTGIPWAFSLTSLPFSIALLPLIIVVWPKQGNRRWWRGCSVACGLGVGLAALYVLVQILQTGDISVGVHKEMTALNIWQGPKRIFLNIAHTVQILFSVHNYYFIDPARTGHGNMLQTSPVLMVLSFFALFASREYFHDKLLPLALALGALIGIGLNVFLDHMDHFYMETGVFFLILAALPVLRQYPLWIPVVLATLHFQWFYFFLQHGEVFRLEWWFFAIPAFVDVCFVLYVVVRWREVWREVRWMR